MTVFRKAKLQTIVSIFTLFSIPMAILVGWRRDAQPVSVRFIQNVLLPPTNPRSLSPICSVKYPSAMFTLFAFIFNKTSHGITIYGPINYVLGFFDSEKNPIPTS